jgi:hypothetical protein
MYPKTLTALAGLCILFLTACTGTAHLQDNKDIPVTGSHPAPVYSAALKKTSLTGPPEYIPAMPANGKTGGNSGIIEKGGRYVYIPPAYIMARPEKGSDGYAPEVLQRKVGMIRKFASANNYDTTLAFFVDMQVKSGKNRFFVVNLANGDILKKGLVAHGKGDQRFTFDKKFSNEEGSNCTSLGIYKIGKAYNGAFGLSYKLYGLNKTNSNALKRYVVLHSMGSIPPVESKWPITQTEGCPAVAPGFLVELAAILDRSPKNILLYIYNGTH